jgi:glutaredoxin
MSETRQIEIFIAGCAACDEAVRVVKAIACSSCEIHVLDMHQAQVAEKAGSYGIKTVPAVVVDGKVADCCQVGGVDEATLRQLGVGTPSRS